MKVKDYLLQAQKLDAIIKNKTYEKEQWIAIATSTTASSEGERVQASASQQKMENAVLKFMEIEKEIDSCIENMIYTKKEIISQIEKLNAVEYDVLHLMYIQGKTFDEIADLKNKSYSWATTVHGRALKHLQDIIEKGETNEE